MKEFHVYHFNWTTKEAKKDLIAQMNDDSCDKIMATSLEKAVKFYIKEHGLPSNDSALVGVKEVGGKTEIVIASTNKNRTCTVSPYKRVTNV